MPFLWGAHGARPARLLRAQPMAKRLLCHLRRSRGAAAPAKGTPLASPLARAQQFCRARPVRAPKAQQRFAIGQSRSKNGAVAKWQGKANREAPSLPPARGPPVGERGRNKLRPSRMESRHLGCSTTKGGAHRAPPSVSAFASRESTSRNLSWPKPRIPQRPCRTSWSRPAQAAQARRSCCLRHRPSRRPPTNHQGQKCSGA